MAIYQFNTITAAQALAILPTDTVVTGDYAPNPRVTFLPATANEPERVQITLGDGPFEHTVVFGTNIIQLSSEGRFSFSYTEKLLIGGAGGETMSGTYVFGGGGADSLSGSQVTGGDGNDTLNASTPNGAAGSMSGGNGNDVLIATGRTSYGSGGEGYDTVVLSGARDDYVLYGTDGGVSIFGPNNNQFSFSSVEKLIFSDGERALVNTLSLTGPDPSNRPAEGNSGEVAHRFVATRTGDLTSSITVDWHTKSVNNADIVNPNGQVTFQAGQSQAEFFVYTPGDTEPEFMEHFEVTLDNGPTWLFDGRTAASGVNNDDGDNFVVLNVYRSATGPDAFGPPEGNSGSTAIRFTVDRSGDTTIASQADYRVIGVDRHSASQDDFVGGAFPTGSISFAAGEITKTITVYVQGDRVIETDEYFKLQFVNVSANTSVNYGDNYGGATGIILNDDIGPNADDGPSGPPNVLAITRNQAALAEGHSGVTPFTFTLNRTGNTTQPATVDYRVTGSGDHPADAADFQGGILPSGTVTFAAGETTKTITINVRGDATVEPDEGFTVTLSNATGTGAVISTVQASATIYNDEADRPPETGGGTTTPPTDAAPNEPSLTGGDGPDTIQGTAGDDIIHGGNGVSYLRGGEGNDIIAGGAHFDDINGNQGDDTASGGFGDDWVVGGKDNDFLTGDGGDDIVYGNLGSDTCDGGDGNDLVRGGQQDDVVRGGAGDDWLSGDRGDDTITGGSGADTFHTFGDAGIDRVLDFSRAEGDRVQLDPGTKYSVSQVGADTVIQMEGGGQMILVGVAQASLTGDWIFGA